MNTIKQTYVIAATPEEVWRALTDPAVIREWSGDSADYTPEVGAPYSLWNGSIVGEIVEIAPGERLIQTWRPADWTRQDSVVRFTLVPEEGTTLVDLVHENVEEGDYDGTNEGWDIYYLGAIKRLLEGRETTRKTAQDAKPKMTRRSAKTPKAQVARKSTARKSAAKSKPAAKKATSKKKPTAKKSTTRTAARRKRSS